MLRTRSGKRVRRVLHTREGVRLHEVAYRLPDPFYRARGCGPSIKSVHPDDVLEGIWAAVVESDVFCGVLERMAPGLGKLVRDDNELGVGPNAVAGGALNAFIMSVASNVLLPILIRATEIRTADAAEKFVAAWTDPAMSNTLRQLAKEVSSSRKKEQDADLARRLREVGLTLRAYAEKDGQAPRDGASAPRRHLRYIINESVRLGGG